LIDKIKLEVSDLKICFCDGRFSFVDENFVERDERGTGRLSCSSSLGAVLRRMVKALPIVSLSTITGL
jgi:hypothetical protein